jgi:hypothetical protein
MGYNKKYRERAWERRSVKSKTSFVSSVRVFISARKSVLTQVPPVDVKKKIENQANTIYLCTHLSEKILRRNTSYCREVRKIQVDGFQKNKNKQNRYPSTRRARDKSFTRSGETGTNDSILHNTTIR